jgi:3,4-dihydroxy-9,10-secoandrosta-1,3,5(10)-triene-9,17-dione 4,5-dioxygenase
MSVVSLGYLVVGSTDIQRWRQFGADQVGFMVKDGPDGALWLRIDDRPFRFLIVPGTSNGLLSSGWELVDEAAFETCIAALEAHGHAVTRAPAATAASRCANGVATLRDPAGNQVELFHGRFRDYQPFVSPQGVSGFVTGDMGLGHVVLSALNLDETEAFYKQFLGFGNSDEMHLQVSPNPADPRLVIKFMHCDNPRHHSLALAAMPVTAGAVHAMVEARSLQDVGCALDRCVAAGSRIASALGCHSNDQMVSFYVTTPAGFDLEFGCMGLQPDWSTWVPTRSLVSDIWGHQWAPPPTA